MKPQLSLDSLPTGLLIAVALLAIAQITLDVIALVDLARRPRERVVFDMKWPWVLIIVLVNFVGAIVYLAAGRKPAPVTNGQSQGFTADSAQSVADSLYGEQPRRPE